FISWFFFSSRRRHTRSKRDWSSDVCSSDLVLVPPAHFNCKISHIFYFLFIFIRNQLNKIRKNNTNFMILLGEFFWQSAQHISQTPTFKKRSTFCCRKQ